MLKLFLGDQKTYLQKKIEPFDFVVALKAKY